MGWLKLKLKPLLVLSTSLLMVLTLTPPMVPTPTLCHMVSMVVYTPPPSSALSTTDTSLPSVRRRTVLLWSATPILEPLFMLRTFLLMVLTLTPLMVPTLTPGHMVYIHKQIPLRNIIEKDKKLRIDG